VPITFFNYFLTHTTFTSNSSGHIAVVKAEIERRMSARDILDGATKRAVQEQVILLDSENETVRQRLAMDILNRTGYGKTSRTESKAVCGNLVFIAKDIERIQEASMTCFGEKIPMEFEDDDELKG